MSVIPGLEPRIESAAQRFVDHTAYRVVVLRGVALHLPASGSLSLPAFDAESAAYGLGALALAVAAAAFGLWRARLPAGVRGAGARVLGGPVAVLRGVHSGIVGDYLLWLCAGTVAVAGVWAYLL